MRALCLTLLTSLAWGVGCDARRTERAPIESVRVALQSGESVLDARSDGVLLLARRHEGDPASDGVASLAVRKVSGASSIELGTLADAKLFDGGVVVLGRDGVLSRLGDDGATRVIDREVYGPLSVRAGLVAYVRGEQPALAVTLASIDRGAPVALAPEWTPAWCPAIAADSTVVFVTARSGKLELARASAAAPPQSLGEPELAPEGPATPLLVDNALVFEHDGALRVLGLDGRLRKSQRGVPAPIALAGDKLIVLGGDRALRVLSAVEVLR